ncbi:UPF0691 protein C9orf116 [Nilaparvata lugens]|uniref:UPF0691 protein C9orf116 n=1 Tax=Nilaparvata lugens TaxID=108931 RepID=UPI000B9880DD|nr:UPF0691 protein C9orf116 [Nilaparvata lugens]
MACTFPPAPRVDAPTDNTKTSDLYKTTNLPGRFEYPQFFSNYGVHRRPPPHPFYVTTASEVGYYPPSLHTVPLRFYPRSQRFSSHLAKCGMYRNYSLNL